METVAEECFVSISVKVIVKTHFIRNYSFCPLLAFGLHINIHTWGTNGLRIPAGTVLMTFVQYNVIIVIARWIY